MRNERVVGDGQHSETSVSSGMIAVPKTAVVTGPSPDTSAGRTPTAVAVMSPVAEPARHHVASPVGSPHARPDSPLRHRWAQPASHDRPAAAHARPSDESQPSSSGASRLKSALREVGRRRTVDSAEQKEMAAVKTEDLTNQTRDKKGSQDAPREGHDSAPRTDNRPDAAAGTPPVPPQIPPDAPGTAGFDDDEGKEHSQRKERRIKGGAKGNQVYKLLRAKILSGDIDQGARITDLFSEYEISPSTQARITARLKRDQVAYSIPGQGTFAGRRPEHQDQNDETEPERIAMEERNEAARQLIHDQVVAAFGEEREPPYTATPQQAVEDLLRRQFDSGALKVYDKITARSLASELGYSSVTTWRGLLPLAERGIVEITQQGTFMGRMPEGYKAPQTPRAPRKSIRKDIEAYIRHLKKTEQVQSGDSVDIEELASRFNTSGKTVRRAMDQLKRQGIVQGKQGSSTTFL